MQPMLNRKLTLETPARVADGAGGFDTAWTALGSLWGQVSARTGREANDISQQGHRVTVRAAPLGSPRRPAPGQRFREGTRLFQIHAVSEADATGRYLQCDTREETAT